MPKNDLNIDQKFLFASHFSFHTIIVTKKEKHLLKQKVG